MSATVTPILEDVFTALMAFIQGIVGTGVPIVRGIDNRVPPPTGPFVMLTPLFQNRLSTNVTTYLDSYPSAGPEAKSVMESMRLDVQIDCFGPNSSQWSAMLSTLLRDEYGCTSLAPSCQPLYADEPRMMPLSTGEEQYLERWMLQATLQYLPATTLDQQFAGAAAVELVDVDVSYPP